jgi:hypothetical protein
MTKLTLQNVLDEVNGLQFKTCGCADRKRADEEHPELERVRRTLAEAKATIARFPAPPTVQPRPACLVAVPGPFYFECIARRAITAAKQFDGLRDEPQLFFFRPSGSKLLGYFHAPRELWISLELPNDVAVLRTIEHEIAHMRQHQRGDPLITKGISSPGLEAEAEAFAQRRSHELIRAGLLHAALADLYRREPQLVVSRRTF